ncbi:heterokaryon incompatibility protein het-E-1 [Fusarium phyllophilum]|uniref:Heterokaryon incompatibility protein het-E-1 n=1 Tax=Fusarium phyllophilum TaxID=47803 RepID=A0A8H5IJQ8_9HYPO|nr:heterokaryon incompatibility protein het-E-1 [Fusarium phyllophilum]
MATNQHASFERSLDLFRRELSDVQIKQINGVNQKTVTDTIQEIQCKLGRRDGLCNLTRIQRFLHAMEHIEKLVTIFLNASDFVAFIWGPIKLALMVATTWTDAIWQLIDAYEEIAEALGNLAFFHNLIQSRDHLKLVLDDYFSDILRFHQCVLDVFSRPEWKRLFKWAWGSFRREVKPILESLKRKQALLSDDKLQSHAILKEVQDSGQYAKDQFSNLQTSLEDIRSTLASEQLQSKTLQAQEMKTYLESRLDVSKSRTDLQLESRDPVDKNSGIWIFSNPIFKSWEGGKSAEKRVLFLNGSPGSGKSTLAKTIIRHKQRKKAAEPPGRNLLAYFFFKHDAADRRTARSMLQHLIMQLVNTDETLMRFVYDRLSTTESTELADLKSLASECLTSRLLATLVLDGLDEAIDNEHEVSINWCLNELLPAAKSRGCSLNVLICAQRDGRLDALLSSHAQIRLDNVVGHQHDIEQFIKEQAVKIRARFSLTQEEELSLISKVSDASQGMFLYARVVLDNLAAMDSIQEFEDELEADTFPENLEKAYLVHNDTVNLLQEHIDMALFCCRYLSSRPFTTGNYQDISADIQSGYSGFLDYAAAHYAAHIKKVAEISRGSSMKLESVKAAAAELAKAHCKEAPAETEDIDKEAQDLSLVIQNNVCVVRNLIGLKRQKSETYVFFATEGPLRHKCHKISCSKFATGCSNEAALKEHLSVHERPFRCPHTDCFAHIIGHTSQKQQESHNKTFHHTTTGVKVTFPTGSKASEWNLYEACKAGDLDEVKRFHREGADLKVARLKYITPLCAAAEAGHGPVCKSPRNPITGVINRSHLDILELFLHCGNGPDDSNMADTIAWAIHANSPSALSMVLTMRQPIEHADVIKLVPDASLMHAWWQYVKPEFYNEKGVFIVQSNCLEYKIWREIFFREHNFFNLALRDGCYFLAMFLMDIGNDEYLQIRNEIGDTPLHSCMKGLCSDDCSSCMSMFQRLFQYEGSKSANITTRGGRLPAHLALSYGVPQAVLRAVLGKTEDFNYRDNLGCSLLHVASSADSIRVLLENGSVDLFSRNNKGQTAFSAFIDRSYVLEVEVLDHLFKADPRLASTPDKSEKGLTPLHYALEPIERNKPGSYYIQSEIKAAKFLLTCSEVERVLVEYQAKSTHADRRMVRAFAEEENLQKALGIMDSIGFNSI